MMSFPPGTEMFQFPGFASFTLWIQVRDTWFAPPISSPSRGTTSTKHQVGCPIRRSTDQSLFPAPRSLSQGITSFIASCCQGIHQTPFSRLIRSRERKAGLLRPGPCRPHRCGPPSVRKSYILSAPAPMRGTEAAVSVLDLERSRPRSGNPRGSPPPAPPLTRGCARRLRCSLFTMSFDRPHRTGEPRTPWARRCDETSSPAGDRLVEPVGIEPTTPCLQSRCSPS